MSIFVFILIILMALALLIYAIDLIPGLDGVVKNLIKIVLIVGAALWILSRAGLIH